MRACIGQDALERAVGAVANADQRAEDVERHQLRPQTTDVFVNTHCGAGALLCRRVRDFVLAAGAP
jgi:hypothetical protein